MNRLKKDFIAHAALEFAKEFLRMDVANGEINSDTDGDYFEDNADWVSTRATIQAWKLADALDERLGNMDGTVFFDPDDNLLTGLEESLTDISSAIRGDER